MKSNNFSHPSSKTLNWQTLTWLYSINEGRVNHPIHHYTDKIALNFLQREAVFFSSVFSND